MSQKSLTNQHKAITATQLPSALNQLLSAAKKNQQSVVLATGVFDLLHQEHRNFLQKAQVAGDILIVGIESDKRVRQIKGEGRPINSEVERRKNLTELAVADYVFILPDQFSKPKHHRNLIAEIQPDILAVSSHTKHLDKKQAIVEAVGGEVKIVHQHNPNVSTTLLLQQQQEQ